MWSRLPFLAFKIITLLSFCGGPLLTSDLLKPVFGVHLSFLLGMGPVAMMAFGVLTIKDDEENETIRRGSMLVGALGAVGVLLLNAFAIFYLALGQARPDQTLIGFGILVGLCTGLAYLRICWKTLER